MNKTYYEILGLPKYGIDNSGKKITREDIIEAKDKLVNKNPGLTNDPKFIQVYSVLIDETKRSNYDKTLEEFVKKNKDLEKKEVSNVSSPIFTSDDSQKSKGKEIAKYIAAGFAGSMFGPLGVVGAVTLVKKHNKNKLDKTNKYALKPIVKVTSENSAIIESYNKKLNSEIDKLLSSPRQEYKLRICRRKYMNHIQLIEQLIQMELSKAGKRGQILKTKLNVIALKIQLNTALENYKKVNKQIKNYSGEKPTLTKLNEDLLKATKAITEEKIGENNSFKIKNLQITQNKLLKKRNKEAQRVKLKVVKSGNMYDGVQKAYQFVRHANLFFTKAEDVEKLSVKIH